MIAAVALNGLPMRLSVLADHQGIGEAAWEAGGDRDFDVRKQ
jgi:hypothetical protein